jgi:hypothetical protein
MVDSESSPNANSGLVGSMLALSVVVSNAGALTFYSDCSRNGSSAMRQTGETRCHATAQA